MTAHDHQSAVELGDRHLRPHAAFEGGAAAAGRRTVRISAGPQVAATASGQQTLWLLANLLARQFAVIDGIEVAVPPVPLEDGVAPFGGRGDLRGTLAETVRLIAGETVAVTAEAGTNSGAAAAVEVSVGRAPRGDALPDERRVSVFGSGWKVFAGRPWLAPETVPQRGNPVGPYFAACVGAGEAFKLLRGLRPGRGQSVGDSWCQSFWDGEVHGSWADTPDGPWESGLVLPPAYLIGAGAVAQAAAATLAAARPVCGHLTVVEHEAVSATNFNRYVLTCRGDLRAPKAQVLARRVYGSGLTVFATDCKWPDYALDPAHRVGQRVDLKRLEDRFRYDTVLSCVDKNSARHAIQAYYPHCVIGGSTDGLSLAVRAYDMRSPYECLKCHNPPEPKGASVEELAEALRALSAQARSEQCRAVGADVAAVEAYLSNPGCGRLGESEVAKFGETAGPDWSVGFVSAAAGTLLAAQFIKASTPGADAFPLRKGNALRFNFLFPAMAWSKHARNQACDCGARGRRAYENLWTAR